MVYLRFEASMADHPWSATCSLISDIVNKTKQRHCPMKQQPFWGICTAIKDRRYTFNLFLNNSNSSAYNTTQMKLRTFWMSMTECQSHCLCIHLLGCLSSHSAEGSSWLNQRARTKSNQPTVLNESWEA